MTPPAGETLDLRGRITRLRDFRADDVDAVHAVVGDDRVTRFLSFDSRDREQAATMLTAILGRSRQRPRLEYYLAVTDLDADDVVGFVRLGLSGVRAAKLGYAVAAEHQGRGVATDAVAVALDLAFSALELHRVTAAIGPDNAASTQVVQRLGFTREGVLRDHVHTNGAWRDSVLHSLLAPEWPAAGRRDTAAHVATTSARRSSVQFARPASDSPRPQVVENDVTTAATP